MGAYVVRKSSLNDNHSCQLFRMGLRDNTTPTSTTHLIRANMSCGVATIFSSLALLSSSISTANLSCLLATTFSSLRYLSNSFSSPHFNLLSFESGRALFLVVFCFLIQRFHRGCGLLLLYTICGNRVLYAESSNLGKLITSEIINDLQLIVRSYKYLNICNPPLKLNG